MEGLPLPPNTEGFLCLRLWFLILPAAGQEVMHLHFHIIPRSLGDKKISVKRDPSLASDEAINEMYNKII